MNTKLLEDIGLTKSEIAVYLALLELGSSSTGKIVDKSKVSSSKIYEILDKLIQKGLASYIIKSGVKNFEAAPPKRIVDYVKEKENKLEKQKIDLEKLLPELELKRTLSEYKSEATIFKGMKGGETAFKYLVNSMKKNDEWLSFVITFENKDYFRMLTKIHKERAKKGLKARQIINERHKQYTKERGRITNTKLKFVPDEQQNPTIVNVAGNITLINIMGEEITVFMIESKNVADSFRKQFEKMWSQETIVLKGIDAFKTVLNDILECKKLDWIGARGYFVDREPNFINDWEKEAIKKGLKVRNIVDPKTKGHRITKFPFIKTKFTLPKEFANLSVFWIYKNKVAISNWAGDEPIIMIIENKQIVDMYKKQFELLWKK